MKIIDVVQGSPEWHAARLGVPTASNFDRIITPTGKASAQADKYLAQLACEWFLGEPVDLASSQFMERGTAMEPEARAYYAFDTDQVVKQVGFCTLDDGSAGASPDSFVGDKGLLEIKVPSAVVQMQYHLGGFPTDYFVQVQGQLWVTEREWCDLLAYSPVLPKPKVHYDRDETFIAKMAALVREFSGKLAEAREKLAGEKAERDAARREAIAAADSEHPF